MMTRNKYLFLFVVLASLGFFLSGCSSGRQLAESSPEVRTLDTLVVGAPMPNALKDPEDYELSRFNPSAERAFQLIHTRLELAFDWEQQHVLGTAILTLKPWFYPQDSLILDAKNFLIHSVEILEEGQPTEIAYRYDGNQLTVFFQNTQTAQDTLLLNIAYTARPAERTDIGGGSAISSDQGLFFINPTGKEGDTPRQIWTQGETEYNSCWFPTIDKPNQRCTQEVLLTVDTAFETLSNGMLVASDNNGDGTRTDYWKLDQPHAPYLFMVAIGDYAVVDDQWHSLPLSYYVEHDYRDDADAIFAHTPEMMELFSNLLGVPFPWPKYAQVVVRDYVSGAMENTTASVFGEFVQQTRRELIDNDNDLIVAHELFHQWFGDLVTCESWANLTMNEGFANYSEYLWLEHHKGEEEAEYHRLNEMDAYFRQAARNPHDLIYYDYQDMEATFDAHSYNKGGLVLHMLRKWVGNEAFFASLNRYLNDNAYTAVEADDLRLAFEEVTGRDLTRFFEQWFFSSGHPELNIDYVWDPNAQEVRVTVEQVQDPDRFPPIFILPAAIELFYGKNVPKLRFEVMVDRRIQTFVFPSTTRPRFVAFDADESLLAEKSEEYSFDELVDQYYFASAFPDRLQAFQAVLSDRQSEATNLFAINQLIVSALTDPSPMIRAAAVREADISNPEVLNRIADLASSDPHSMIRAAALDVLGRSGNSQMAALVREVIGKDEAYPVIAAGLRALPILDFEQALEVAEAIDPEGNMDVVCGLASVFAYPADPSYLDFFADWMPVVDGYSAFDFFGEYAVMVVRFQDEQAARSGLMELLQIGCNPQDSPWRRVAAYRALDAAAEMLAGQQQVLTDANEETSRISGLLDQIETMQETIKSHESNNSIRRYF